MRFFLLRVCIVLFAATGAFAQGAAHKNILMVSSFNLDTDWGRSLVQGFNSAFPIEQYAISYVGIGNWDNPDTISTEKSLGLILEKVAKTKYDILVAFDQLAIDMVAQHLDKFPKDLKIVLAGASDPNLPGLEGRPDVQVAEIYVPFEENLRLARRMYPNTGHIVAFFEAGIDGVVCEEELKRVAAHMEDDKAQIGVENAQLTFINGRDYSTTQALAKLSAIAKEPVCVLFYSWSSVKDNTWESLDLAEFAKRVSKIADKNVIVFFDDVSDSILGGYMVSGLQYAAYIGQKTKRILSGETVEFSDAKEICALRINWDVFSEKGFSTDIMPPSTIFYHESHGVLEVLDFRYVSGGLALLALIFAALLAVALRSIIASRRNSTLLRDSRHELKDFAYRMRTTLNSIGDAVIATDQNGLITFVNPVARRMLGKSGTDIIGERVDDIYKIYSQADSSPLPPPTQRIAGLECAIPINSRYMPTGDGARMHIADSVSPIVIDGKAEGLILVFRDVTREYLQREQITSYAGSQEVIIDCLSFALRSDDHEANVDRMLESLAKKMGSDRAFMYKFNPDNGDFSSLKYWNDPRIGDKEFKIGKVPPDEGKLMMEKFANGEVIKYNTGPGHENPEFPGLLKLHREDEIKVSMVVGVFESGKICGFMGADYVTQYHDYTKSDESLLRGVAKVAEIDFEKNAQAEKVRIGEKQRKLILDSVDTPIMLFDAQARLMLLNNAAAHFMEKPIERIMGGDTSESASAAACRHSILTRIERAIREKRPMQEKINLWGRDLIANAIPVFDKDGSVMNVIESATDVTQLVEASKKLEKAMQAAQESDRAKSYFLATMSHELRTPLNAVIGYSELTQNPKLSVEDRVENLRSINFAANTLLNLINDILDLSKLEAGQLEMKKVPICLRSVAMEFANIFKFEAKKKGIQLDMDVPQDMPMLMMDLLRLKQVLMNVIGNAVKFTSQGAVAVKVSFERKPNERGALTVSVKDSGIGIAPENLQRIFNPFEQDNTQRVRARGGFEGTGLGLTIVRRLLEKMGGTISVESKPDMGSTFTLHFESLEIYNGAAAKAAASAPVAASMDDSTFDATVLVVDDVPLNVKVIRNILKNFGVNVLDSYGAQEALEILKTTTPDLIMTDLWMPDINGEELAKRVKANAATSAIPVIAVTADIQVEDPEKVFDSLLFKPITMKGIFGVLEKYLPERRRVWSRSSPV